jgi:hypothetical protein
MEENVLDMSNIDKYRYNEHGYVDEPLMPVPETYLSKYVSEMVS